MARSSLSSRFRRLDIDQFDENRFVEEPDGAEAGSGAGAAEGNGGAGPEVEAALRQYPFGGLGGGVRGEEEGLADYKTHTPPRSPPPDRSPSPVPRSPFPPLPFIALPGSAAPGSPCLSICPSILPSIYLSSIYGIYLKSISIHFIYLICRSACLSSVTCLSIYLTCVSIIYLYLFVLSIHFVYLICQSAYPLLYLVIFINIFISLYSVYIHSVIYPLSINLI